MVKEAAKGFKVVAVSKYNVVEAIEKEGEDFVIGIQWHPEMMSAEHDYM
ncbi:gamma-glutamyl-gamma-aminobutyrate hydrolase family protein [Haloimpatiens lingqiaonensis]|nr:gamma-glutamyl-gamma-aminobutyrate hydrolase family protein [Haloimpatiens lingqiaonensis]